VRPFCIPASISKVRSLGRPEDGPLSGSLVFCRRAGVVFDRPSPSVRACFGYQRSASAARTSGRAITPLDMSACKSLPRQPNKAWGSGSAHDCFEAVYVKDGETYYCKVEQSTEEFWQATVPKGPLHKPQDDPIGADSLEDAKEQAHDALVYKLGLEPATTLDLTWRKCPE
jgi:hypothetical protein